MLYLGRAPRTKETLPDFQEWCRVTRHPLVFRVSTGSQRTPGFWGVTILTYLTHIQHVIKLPAITHKKNTSHKITISDHNKKLVSVLTAKNLATNSARKLSQKTVHYKIHNSSASVPD